MSVDLPEELAHRSADGVEVVLLWDRGEDRLRVIVADTERGKCFELRLAKGESPMDAFHHPFSYLAPLAPG